jgi:RHS repeat-associated protein
VWHTIGLSFKNYYSSSSQDDKYLDLRVIVDDKTYTNVQSVSFELTSLSVSLGRKFQGKTIISNFGTYVDTFPLSGQMEMLATRAAYCELSTLLTLVEELNSVTKVNEFDELGMKQKSAVHLNGSSILSNTYKYKTRSDSKYLSSEIAQETIKTNDVTITRKYTTDALGNVISITDDTFGNHQYEYDYRGFLIKDNDESYTYDSNGNITKMGTTIFQYDSVIKDRLISCGGNAITYDTSNPLNPSSYDGTYYRFEGRRLTRIYPRSGYYDYFYNDQGLRIKKVDYRGVTTQYIYDNEKLISEDSPNGRLDFLYDENDNLYGFIKDGKDKYLYIRDWMQNILGICNISGEIIVKYAYSAYGTCRITSDTSSSSIGTLNPFRYKGYYYDNESNMYYCHSRYYVPSWGRWLNGDNPTYLSFDNLMQMNLYSYCYNNPILYIDKSGHFPVLTCILAITALIGLGLTIAGVATDNNLMTGIGLTMVSVPALISGGLAIAAGIGGATLTGIIGGVTLTAGIGSGLFASAEYQEAKNGNNWIQDTTGMSDGLYNSLLISTASVATLGTIASGIGYSFNIKSISQIGCIDGKYNGVRFVNKNNKTLVLSFHTHGHKVAHGLKSILEWHWHLKKWNPITMKTGRTIARWIWWSLTKF